MEPGGHKFRGTRRSTVRLIAAGYVLAIAMPVLGMIVSFLVAQDQSRPAKRHAVRIFGVAVASTALGVLLFVVRS